MRVIVENFLSIDIVWKQVSKREHMVILALLMLFMWLQERKRNQKGGSVRVNDLDEEIVVFGC